jgi:peroxiredoxin
MRTNYKRTLQCFIVLLPLVTNAQHSFQLDGNIKGLTSNTLVYLFYSQGQKLVKDSTIAMNGSFTFKGNIAEPSRATVRIDKDGKVADITTLYVTPGKLIIKGTDSLRHAKVIHSKINDDYYAWQKLADPIVKALLAERTKAAQLVKDSSAKEQLKQLNENHAKTIEAYRTIHLLFIRSHPDSYVAFDLLKSYAGMRIVPKEISPLFNAFSEKVKITPSAAAFAARIEKAGTIDVGSSAPKFVSLTTAGDSLSLSTIIGQSKYVLLDFWASWCKPCRAENPNVVKAYQQFHDKGFNILSVSLDSKSEPWKAAIVKDNMPWFHASSLQGWQEPVALLYSVNSVPDNFLIDAKGNIVARGLRGEKLEEKLKELLGED